MSEDVLTPVGAAADREPAHQATDDTRDTRKALGIAVALTLAVSAIVLAFVLPVIHSGPRDLPISIVGPAQATAGVERGLQEQAGTGAFAVNQVADRAAAVDAIKNRDSYGAVVITPSAQGARTEVLIATGASSAVAQQLTAIATGLSHQQSEQSGRYVPVPVTDVAPAASGDPRGSGFAAAALPFVITGLATGAVLALVVPGLRDQLLALGSVMILASLALTGILQGWLDLLAGNYFANAAVVALGIGAISATVLGFRKVLGTAGIGLGAILMLPIGVPLSGIQSAPELLPDGWSTLGQLLPPGALGSALRSTAFFDGNAAGGHLIVLGIWVILGLTLAIAAGSRRGKHEAHQEPAREERALAPASVG